MNRFICLLGGDGAGKSTMLAYMRDVLGLNFIISNWSEYGHMLDIPGISRSKDVGKVLVSLPPRLRSCAITSMANVLYYANIEPKLNTGVPIISECYYFRVLAAERVHNVIEDWCYKIVRDVPAPALTVFLRVNPSIMFERKKAMHMSRYEYLRAPDDFITFQQQVIEYSLEEARRRSEVIEIDVMRSVEENVAKLVSILQTRMGWFK